jgi:hypothetical protein
MFKGHVDLTARVSKARVMFPKIVLSTARPHIESIEIEAPTGDDVICKVLVAQTNDSVSGRELATSVAEAVLDRLSFMYGSAIGPALVTGSNFSPIDPVSGLLHTASGSFTITGSSVEGVQGISPEVLKSRLDSPNCAGETYFGHYRSARLSVGPVEEFMHLYSLLLDLLGGVKDEQKLVDAFVQTVEPTIALTPSPAPRLKNKGVTETTYTRLRNELAHRRPGVDVAATKKEMALRLSGLRAVARAAIEKHG